MSKPEAIMFAYQDCARAIYQSWGVIGLGLAAFSLSSFTPTQRFGCLMFAMLTVSSVGNLVLLPSLLAGPLGKYFWLRRRQPQGAMPQPAPSDAAVSEAVRIEHPAEAEPVPVPNFQPAAAEQPNDDDEATIPIPVRTGHLVAGGKVRVGRGSRKKFGHS
jgi:hypothetical protein